ncbi:hypothetical protein Tco_1282791 [Tanacetum coccineum]
MFQNFRYSDTVRPSRRDEVLKLKNFEKDASLQLSSYQIKKVYVILMEKRLLTEDCYAQLHNAANTPCPAHDGFEAVKIDQKHTFGPKEKLKFLSPVCTSAFLWPLLKDPPLPELPHWLRNDLSFIIS